MLCSQDNMPATQSMNMMQPIPLCHILNALPRENLGKEIQWPRTNRKA